MYNPNLISLNKMTIKIELNLSPIITPSTFMAW